MRKIQGNLILANETSARTCFRLVPKVMTQAIFSPFSQLQLFYFVQFFIAIPLIFVTKKESIFCRRKMRHRGDKRSPTRSDRTIYRSHVGDFGGVTPVTPPRTFSQRKIARMLNLLTCSSIKRASQTCGNQFDGGQSREVRETKRILTAAKKVSPRAEIFEDELTDYGRFACCPHFGCLFDGAT